MNELQAIASLLAIYGALWLANTVLAIRNNLSKGFTFQWPVFWDGVIRAALGAGALTIGAVALIYVPQAFEAAGISVGADTQKAISMLAILAAIGSGIVVYAQKFLKQIGELFNPDNELKPEMQIEPDGEDWNKGEIILGVGDLPEDHGTKGDEVSEDTIKEIVAAYLAENPEAAAPADLETDSGRGAVVTTSSPDAFRNAVIGKGFDIDGWYGWQCWDAAALFWYSAVGRSCSTGGTGAARGCWEAARSVNAGTEFELITDRNKIQKGDWLVFGGTQWGHIGMAMSGNLGNYVKLLSENQGVGAANKNGGYAFSEINMSLSNFLGAFRLKKWHKASSPAPSTSTYKVVKTINGYLNSSDASKRKNAKVKINAGTYYVFNKAAGMVNVTAKKGTPGAWINPGDNKAASSSSSSSSASTYKVVKSINGYISSADASKRKNAKVTVKAATYYVFNKASGMINVTSKKGVPGSWINPGDNKATTTSKPAAFKVGQTVKVKKAVDTAGRALKVSGTYKISELKGTRAVITKGGVVVAAISTNNLSHA